MPAARRRLHRLGRHLRRGGAGGAAPPAAVQAAALGSVANTVEIEGQAVVTAALAAHDGPPPPRETRRLVDALLYGAGVRAAPLGS